MNNYELIFNFILKNWKNIKPYQGFSLNYSNSIAFLELLKLNHMPLLQIDTGHYNGNDFNYDIESELLENLNESNERYNQSIKFLECFKNCENSYFTFYFSDEEINNFISKKSWDNK